MSQAERIKENSWLAQDCLRRTDMSLVAWLAQNFRTAEAIMVVLAVVAVAGTTTGIVGVNNAAFCLIAQLEDL